MARLPFPLCGFALTFCVVEILTGFPVNCPFQAPRSASSPSYFTYLGVEALPQLRATFAFFFCSSQGFFL